MQGSTGQRLRGLGGHPPVVLGGVLFVGVLITWAILLPGPLLHRSLPDFSKVEAGPGRKAAFFEFLNPYIDESNARVLAVRKRLQGIQRLHRGAPISRSHLYWLETIGKQVGMDLDGSTQPTDTQLETLLLKLDIIPPSLALAQAALESGWGTSRFAREGNNLFGMWCYEPGCGMVPRHRPAGATYEVTRYHSPRESFNAYINNLNSNVAYESLWLLRQQSRLDGRSPTGLELADGLYRYSQEEWLYVSKIKGVIKTNNLSIYDQ